VGAIINKEIAVTFVPKIVPSLVLAFTLIGGSAVAEPPHGGGGGGGEHGGGAEHAGGNAEHAGGGARPAPQHPGEEHQGPKSYDRVNEPRGWNTRPATVDMNTYHHNFQAARSYKIGPYRRPAGWVSHHWMYGQTLPRAYWGSQFVLSDYWLFALEVPPVGYEWVRDDDDALLVNISTGEILQAEYGVFN
jgi:Ni/Co efflux regulator RcnB